jgi:hypothetical protein
VFACDALAGFLLADEMRMLELAATVGCVAVLAELMDAVLVLRELLVRHSHLAGRRLLPARAAKDCSALFRPGHLQYIVHTPLAGLESSIA